MNIAEIEHCNELIGQYDKIETMLERASAAEPGSLSIAFSRTHGRNFLEEALGRLSAEEHDGVRRLLLNLLRNRQDALTAELKELGVQEN